MNDKEKSALQKEIVASLPLRPHGRLLLAPRVGKSKLAIDIIKLNKPVSILWVTPSAKLATEDIPAEFITWKAKAFVAKLTTVTWMSLDKVFGYFDMVILDEEQFATENNLQNLISGHLKYGNIISMTGTSTSHDVKLDLYKQLKLPILYELSINDAVDIGMLANYSIKVIEVSLGKEKTIKAGTKDKPFMTSEESNYDYVHKMTQQAIFQKRKDVTFQIMKRMRVIKGSPSKTAAAEFLMKELKGRKMFFCAGIEQAETLTPHTFHSKTNDEDLNRFMTGELDTIAMVNSGGTGFTYKAIDHLVMIQADSDKNGLTSQKICRTLLQQKDYKATIWILSLVGTQDEKWVASALERFDKTKVEYIRFQNLPNRSL